MQKLLVSSIVIVAASFSTSAMALDISVKKTVVIEYDREDVEVGTLRCDPPQYRADEEGEILGYPTEWCEYICKWKNAAELPLTANLYLWEKQKSGHYDCRENSKESIATYVINSPNQVSKGFDYNNQKKTIRALSAAATGAGDIYGTVSFRGLGYTNYGIHIADGEAEEPEEPEEEEEGEE
ncbi:hypothetical protein [Sorangium sp. So ce1335]|uniref:hypothetical protein n=1 Tax=Sorangium sp. So ce1335 TaxID=3133335 RepID=UPI003F63C320